MTSPEPDRSFGALMKLAGEREQPSPEAMERAREAAEQAWRGMLGAAPAAVAARKPRRVAVIALAAAAGIAAIALLAGRFAHTPAPTLVAHVATLEGGAVMHTERGDSVVMASDAIYSQSTLSTGEGRVALVLGESLSLRIDRHTRLRFDATDRVTLLAGKIYVDSGGVNATTRLHVGTPAGEARHVGTQFLVFVAGSRTTVRVREGRVLFNPADDGAERDVSAGDELRIEDGRAELEHGQASFGNAWEWTTAVSPHFDIENRPLAEFIAWVAREHGWQVRYGSEVLQQQTYEIRLHGALETAGVAPMIERISLITGVALEARDGVLWVGAPAERR